MCFIRTRLALPAVLLAAGLFAGAAAPPDSAVAPLAPSAWSQQAPVKRTVTATNVIYQAAPVPNPDASAPPDVTRPEPRLGPKFISPHSLFDGDGFSNASSEEASLDGRRRAAAGLGLSVPILDNK
jgi:hypothetical protein